MSETKTQTLPLLPLKEGVILPHMVVTISVDAESSDESFEAIAAARRADGMVLLVPRVEGEYARIGTVGKLEDNPQGAMTAGGEEVYIVRGLYRAVVGTGVPGDGGNATWVEAQTAEDPHIYPQEVHGLAKEYRALVENILEMRGERGVARFLRGITNPGHLADTSGYSPYLTFDQKRQVLETVDVKERLEKLLVWNRETLADFSLKDKIHKDVAEGMEKTQREFLLRQQMEAIKKELGEEGDDVVAEYRAKFAKINMPDDIRKEVEKELDRLERTSAQNPEQGYIRNYLDWMSDLPWDTRSDDNFDINEARAVLDADHTGLEDVKDRIIEFLAVKKLRDERGMGAVQGRGLGAIITLVGPPGVGKTSLGESVARAMGRKFARVSLGGIHDEAEIRGHRRTYVGALPGRIVRALKEAGTKNPVIMFDEIDKVGADWRGDPSSALLEVLDPAQNHSFRDHYLDVDLDLSEVLFIPTANVAETIPGPLLDRMEIVRLDGYTEQEKLGIAKHHLVRRQIERNGLNDGEVTLTDAALLKVIGDYTREAGVRSLEREIGKVLRKAATKIAAGQVATPLQIDAADIKEYLGRIKFHFEAAERTGVPGVSTGLAVTGHGGDVLFIEATEMEGKPGLTLTGVPGVSTGLAVTGHGGDVLFIEATEMEGKPGLTLTGQLGDVMKESAQIALSYVRSHADQLGISGTFENRSFHLHVPAGAVPKDGPSAGTAMTTALVSLLTGRPVKETVAMTGEVTLQGNVLPIGGVKQKLLAAHRAGMKDVILPYRNEADLDDVPESVLSELNVHLAKRIEEVLAIALEPKEALAIEAA